MSTNILRQTANFSIASFGTQVIPTYALSHLELVPIGVNGIITVRVVVAGGSSTVVNAVATAANPNGPIFVFDRENCQGFVATPAAGAQAAPIMPLGDALQIVNTGAAGITMVALMSVDV